MIELTQLNGHPFTLNSDMIETIENIPETKVLLTNGKYFLVKETRNEVADKVVTFRRRIYRNLVVLREESGAAATAAAGRQADSPAKPVVKRTVPGKHGAKTEKE